MGTQPFRFGFYRSTSVPRRLDTPVDVWWRTSVTTCMAASFPSLVAADEVTRAGSVTTVRHNVARSKTSADKRQQSEWARLGRRITSWLARGPVPQGRSLRRTAGASDRRDISAGSEPDMWFWARGV